MKILHLLRHAKSDWPAGVADADRPLKPRGRRAAAEVGRFLAASPPDLVLASTAVRARDTARLAAEGGGWTCPVEPARELYEASPESVLSVVRRQPPGVATLLLVGHEPTWSELVARLVGGGRVRMRTATLATIRFEVDAWTEVAFGTGELEGVWTPREE